VGQCGDSTRNDADYTPSQLIKITSVYRKVSEFPSMKYVLAGRAVPDPVVSSFAELIKKRTLKRWNESARFGVQRF
jgi:hypothetical protein